MTMRFALPASFVLACVVALAGSAQLPPVKKDPLARPVAGREAAIFLERTEGKISADQAATMLQSALRVMLDFFGLLRMKAFMRNIHRESPNLLSPRRKRPKKAKGPPR